MSFFVDPTIATLTSGTLSQNTDLGGMSFPRRMGVRFSPDYIEHYKLLGAQVRWQAYTDSTFSEKLEGDFYHEDTISREGWARYFFKGIFPDQVAWLKLSLYDTATSMLLNEFYFKFVKSYQTSLSGDRRLKDPVTGEKMVKNGVLIEYVPREDAKGNVKYVPGEQTFADRKLNISSFTAEQLMDPAENKIEPVEVQSRAITQMQARYTEKPKMVFLVTPPHLMKYAKIILILVGQLVDMNFQQSYMTKENQKPLYKTRFMLDELGKRLPAHL